MSMQDTSPSGYPPQILISLPFFVVFLLINPSPSAGNSIFQPKIGKFRFPFYPFRALTLRPSQTVELNNQHEAGLLLYIFYRRHLLPRHVWTKKDVDLLSCPVLPFRLLF